MSYGTDLWSTILGLIYCSWSDDPIVPFIDTFAIDIVDIIDIVGIIGIVGILDFVGIVDIVDIDHTVY